MNANDYVSCNLFGNFNRNYVDNGLDIVMMKAQVQAIYDAKRAVFKRDARRLVAMKDGDVYLAARLRHEIEQIKSQILREYKIILD